LPSPCVTSRTARKPTSSERGVRGTLTCQLEHVGVARMRHDLDADHLRLSANRVAFTKLRLLPPRSDRRVRRHRRQPDPALPAPVAALATSSPTDATSCPIAVRRRGPERRGHARPLDARRAPRSRRTNAPIGTDGPSAKPTRQRCAWHRRPRRTGDRGMLAPGRRPARCPSPWSCSASQASRIAVSTGAPAWRMRSRGWPYWAI
jgi:hypothetical protein